MATLSNVKIATGIMLARFMRASGRVGAEQAVWPEVKHADEHEKRRRVAETRGEIAVNRGFDDAEAGRPPHHALEIAIAGNKHADEPLEAIEQADEGGSRTVEGADRNRGNARHRRGHQDGELTDAPDIDAEGRRHVGA